MNKSTMENPYGSPRETHPRPRLKSWLAFWGWFIIILLGMIALNYARLLLTWGTADAYRQIGFPFVVFESGGFSYSERFYWNGLILNAGFAFVVAFCGVCLLRYLRHVAAGKLQTTKDNNA